MKNVKDFIRFNKKALGITNSELQLKADELENSIPFRERISNALIKKDNATFENEKNKIINDCSRQDLENVLINKKCINNMQKSVNRAKEKIVNTDTSNLKNNLIILMCSIISSLLSFGGLILVSDFGNTSNKITCILFGLIMLFAITLNNLVIQNKLFDMFRLQQTLINKFKIVMYALIIISCFMISIITNKISMTYLLRAFKLNDTIKLCLSVAFSGLFDIVPFLINSCKLDFNLCNYNDKFKELFEEKTEVKKDTNLLKKIEENTLKNATEKTTQHSTNKEFFENENAEKNDKKRKTRTSNSKAKSQTIFNNLVRNNIAVGERVTASRLGLENDTTYQNYRNNSKLIEKQGNYYIRVA